MGELHDLTALEQGSALRRGEVSALELVEHYLTRIDEHGADLGAFVTLTGQRARAAAAAVRPRDARPLAGVPTAIKDLTLTNGVRTTFGSAAFADFVPDVDADVVTFMAKAGLISLGKTSTSELGLSLYVETPVCPPARNPWSPGQIAGGSSGGAAAAVAAGLLPFAHGNDGGGSIRIPASICGVVGFKPSRGIVSNGPVGYGSFGLSTHGPLARTVTDTAALLDAMATVVAGEPYPSPPRPDSGFLDAARHPEAYLPKGRPLRVGSYHQTVLGEGQADPQVLAVWQAAAAALVGLGFEVVEVDAPLRHVREQFETLWRVLALAPVPAQREPLLAPLTRWMRELGRDISAEQLVLALTDLQLQVRRHARTNRCDLLLSPVLTMPQAHVGYFSSAGSPAEDFERQVRFSPYCATYNLTGAPAISLPVGMSDAGEPIGVMMAGSLGADALVLAASALLEEAMPWRQRHPQMWSAVGSPIT